MVWSSLSQKTLTSLVEFCFSADKSNTTYHITRLSMYKRLSGCLRHEAQAERSLLSISHSTNLARVVGLEGVKITEANYPKENVTKLSYSDNAFDFCISDQVLEHVEGDPCEAVSETLRVVKPGGFVVHTTCFIHEIHAAPSDFWRYTPSCLSMLVERSGGKVIEVGGWGNQEAWALINLGFRLRPIPDNPDNPVYRVATQNEPSIPIVTWVVAQKLAS